MKLAIVIGTRPEVIKLSPLIRLCNETKTEYVLIHSNQHYSESMDAIFFRELDLPSPHYNLNVGSSAHANQTGNILIKIEPILEKERPDVVVVQGDTNTVMAAALAASKLNIDVAHVEAGLRSYDRTMPEETNRVVTDHISKYLFAVTERQKQILLKEGAPADRIRVVGNTVTDAVFDNVQVAKEKSKILHRLNLEGRDYGLVTVHRASNVDYKVALEEITEILKGIPYPAVWPVHLRTKTKLEQFGLTVPSNVECIEPVGFLDFLALESNAKLIVTDSGGVQEEACILKVPCITLRENTERPETVDVGANILTGRDKEKFFAAVDYFSTPRSWQNPFGDGTTTKKIFESLISRRSSQGGNAQRICVIGLGYMGLPTASILADAGHKVVGVDLNKEKVELINKGICPFEEQGLPELVQKAVTVDGLKAQVSPCTADVFIIAVPTPVKDRSCDLQFVELALESILPFVRNGNLVIIESTIRPKTCLDIVAPFFEKHSKKVLISHCPERAIPGNTMYELVYNDRIVGGINAEATLKTEKLYQSFVKGMIFTTDATTAECAKLMENTYRDVNIAIANEFSEVLKGVDVNPFEAITLANKHPRVNILMPGPGVGGHCIAIDPWFLIENSDSGRLIRTAREINENRPFQVVEDFLKTQGKDAKKVGVLGVAYKKDVDDCRETPAEPIIQSLLDKGLEVKFFDPYVSEWKFQNARSIEELESWSDAMILVTDHKEFCNKSFQKPVFDTRNCLAAN